MVHAVEKDEKDIGPQKENAVVYDRLILRKKGCRRRRQDEQGDRDKDHDRLREGDRDKGPAVGAFLIAGPHVLADEGGRGHGHALHGQHHELIQLVVAAPACHAGRAEIVDIGLDKDIGDRGDDRLDPGGHADRKDLAGHRWVDMEVAPDEPVDVPRPGEQQKRQSR